MACIYTGLSTMHQKCPCGYFCCPHPEPTGAASGSTLLNMFQDVHGFSTMFRVLDYFIRLLIGTLQAPGAGWHISTWMEDRQGNGHSVLSLLLLTCSADSATEPLHSWYSHTAGTATQPALSLCIKLCKEASHSFQPLWNFTSEQLWI